MADLESLPTEKPLGADGLYKAATRLIDEARSAIAYHANVVSVVSNWHLGRLIYAETLCRGRNWRIVSRFFYVMRENGRLAEH